MIHVGIKGNVHGVLPAIPHFTSILVPPANMAAIPPPLLHPHPHPRAAPGERGLLVTRIRSLRSMGASRGIFMVFVLFSKCSHYAIYSAHFSSFRRLFLTSCVCCLLFFTFFSIFLSLPLQVSFVLLSFLFSPTFSLSLRGVYSFVPFLSYIYSFHACFPELLLLP